MARTALRRTLSAAVTTTVLATTLTGISAVALPAVSAFAADACYDPVVKEVNVSQGLPTYSGLIRGKTTLFKAFLGEKQSTTTSCAVLADSSIYITSGSVTVTGQSATPLAVPGGLSLPALPTYTTTTAGDLPGDPVIAIPGSKITSSVPSATPLSFTATFAYTAKDDKRGTVRQTGTISITTLPGTTTPITKTLAATARPLRVLVVPLGDAASSTQQFPAAAQTVLQNAVQAANRIMPVADGVGDLRSTTAGLRYTVASGLVNVGLHDEVQPDGSTASFNYVSGGKFCGGTASFSYLRQKLSDFRLAWNTENPTAPADRVLGAVWQDVSDGPTTTSNSSCVEGYASLNSPEAWIRLTNPATGSPSGATAALELNHTYGGVVNGFSAHSIASTADGTAAGRAYNSTTLKQLAVNKSVMRFSIDAWDNYNTLYEPRDFDFTLCVLQSTASPASECGSATSGGTTAPASGGFALSGLTDYTANGTDAHTRYDIDPPADGTDPGSALRLALVDASNAVVSNTGVRTNRNDSSHAQPSGPTSSTELRYGFDVAIPGAKAAAFELWNGTPRGASSVLLYRRDLNAAPVIGALTTRRAASSVSPFTTDGASSAASAGGAIIARSRAGQVVLSTVDSPTALATVTGDAANVSSDGSTLLVTSGGNVLSYSVTTAPGSITLGAPTTVYTAGGGGPGAASSPLLVGAAAVFTVNGDLYAVDTRSPLLPVSSLLCGIGDALPLAVPGNPCARWTATADQAERAGVSDPARDRVAYTVTNNAGANAVWTLTASNPVGTGVARIAGASDPAIAGDLAIVSAAGGLRSYDADTLTIGAALSQAPGDRQATAVGQRVFFTRPGGATTDINQFSLDRSVLIIPVIDETPQFVRLDIYADCGVGINPLVTATRPTTVAGNTATTEVQYDLGRTCANPVIQVDATDGYSVTTKRTGSAAGSTLTSAGIYSPANGSSQRAYQPIVIAGESTGGDYTYTLTGPAGSGYEQGVVVSSGTNPKAVVQPPTAGFTPGPYTLELATTGADSTVFRTSVALTVLADGDGDGILDVNDTQAKFPCYPANAVNDPVNAVTDYDNDLLISLIDPQPCVSALNATVDFDADSINLGSSGNYITVTIRSTAFDLRTLSASQVKVTQLGSYPVSLVAVSITCASASQIQVKFSRQAFQNAYKSFGLRGYVPVLIRGSNANGTFTGYDLNDPVYTY